MILVANIINDSKFQIFTKNSEHCSLFLVGIRFLMRKIFGAYSLVLLPLLLALSACQPNSSLPQKVTFSGPIMGTQYRITVLLVNENKDKAGQVERDAIQAMESVNESMSTYLQGSEINALNNAPENTKVALSESLYEVIEQSLKLSEMSDGAFDITIGKAVNLWGFGPDGAITKSPSDEQLDAIKSSIGFQKLNLEDSSIIKNTANISIDLSAIAKGYAVDQVAKSLEAYGINNYLIDIGGELRASGFAQGEQAWRVGIEKPHTLGGIQQVIELTNKSIATSGDYRNYHIIDGEHYSHTIDAITLKPVFHRLALVSVVDDTASRADGLATAIMALGDEKGWAFAKQNGLAVYMVVREDEKDQYRVQMTKKFEQYLQ